MRITNKISKITLVLFLFLFQFSFGQKNPVYFQFDTNSKEIFIKEDGSGNKVNESVYMKNIKGDGNIEFYIKNQKFVYNKSEMTKKTLNSNDFLSEKLLSADEVVNYVKKVQEKYPMWYKYPSNEYPKMFIVEKIESCGLLLFEVNWKFYIE